MLGLKNLPMNKLSTAFMVISAAMMIFAAAGSGASSSISALLLWIVCALVLIGVWIAIAYEIFKRFFGDRERSEDHPTEDARSERAGH